MVVPGAAGSGTGSPVHAARSDTEPPPLWSATAPVPPGWQVARCPWLSTGAPAERTVLVPLPPRFETPEVFRDGCYVAGSRGKRQENVTVTLGATTTLGTVAAELESDEGDTVQDVDYATGVPVLGGQPGERLTYVYDSDGALKASLAEQAEGVRLEWDLPAEEADRLAGERDAGTAGVAVEATRTAGCARGTGTGRREVVVTLPASTRRMSTLGGTCWVVPAGGHEATRSVRLDPRPAKTLARLRSMLSRNARVLGLRQVGAHRLRYDLVVLSKPPVRVRVDQRDGLRTTLTAPARHWRTDLRTYAALRASIRWSR